MSTTLSCPWCRQSISASEFVAACSSYWKAINVVKLTCRACGRDTDVCIETGKIEVGYVYAGGSAHFCGVEEIAVDGLEAWSEGADLTIRIRDEKWTIDGIDDE